MPKLLLPLLIVLFFSSCTTYQYFTVDSVQLPKDDKQSFIAENDTMRLTYSFSGPGGLVTIAVFNKTAQTLTINWNRSALICNGQSFPLSQTNSTFTASSSYIHGSGSVTLSGTVSVVPGSEVIPVQSKINQDVLSIVTSLPTLRMIVPDTTRKQRISTDNSTEISYKLATVDENSSPLRMKSYLTFSIGQNPATEFVESNTFYISKAYQTVYGPDLFSLYQPQGNQFYLTWQN